MIYTNHHLCPYCQVFMSPHTTFTADSKGIQIQIEYLCPLCSTKHIYRAEPIPATFTESGTTRED